MAEHAGANLLVGALSDLASYDIPDAAKTVFAAGGVESRLASAFGSRALRHDDHGAFRTLAVAPGDFLGDLVVIEWDFRDQNDIRTASEAAMEGDPARVTTHDLEHHHALVACGRGVEAVEGARHAFHSGVEAESHSRGLEVVVDCFGNAHHGEAGFVKL